MGLRLQVIDSPWSEVVNVLPVNVIGNLVTSFHTIQANIIVPEALLDQFVYNVHVPSAFETIKVGALPAATQRAFALSGYNHTRDGINDIQKWIISGNSVPRPPHILAFQSMLAQQGRKYKPGSSLVSKQPGHSWANFSISGRDLYLSAFDSLSAGINTKIFVNGCSRPSDAEVNKDQLDVLLVHRLHSNVYLQFDQMRTTPEKHSYVYTNQDLHHTVVSEHIVYVGQMSTPDNLLDGVTSMDFLRVCVVDTRSHV